MSRPLAPAAHLTWCVLALLCSGVAAFAAFGAEPASQLPLRAGSSSDLWQTAVRAIFVAVLCLAIVAGALYAWRHRFRLRAGPSIPDVAGATIEWARRASPRTTLVVVRWQGKRYLLAENSTTTVLIDSRPEEPGA